MSLAAKSLFCDIHKFNAVVFCKFPCSLFPLFASTVSSLGDFVHTISDDSRIPVHFTYSVLFICPLVFLRRFKSKIIILTSIFMFMSFSISGTMNFRFSLNEI